MKYMGYSDNGTIEYVDLDAEYVTGPTVLNIAPISEGQLPRQVIAETGSIIVRLASGGWPVIFTEEAFNASFKKVEE